MPGQHRDDVIVQLVEVEGFLVATQTPGVGLVEQLLQPSAGRNTDPVMAARTASSSPAMVRVTKSSLRAGLGIRERHHRYPEQHYGLPDTSTMC